LPEKVLSVIEDILGENIFLSIHPEEGERFLSTVEDLRKEAELIVLVLAVQYLVGFGKFQSVLLVNGCD
jgi:hypothetical protein